MRKSTKGTKGHKQFKALCKKLKKHGVSQEKIAKSLGLTKACINLYVHGYRIPTLATAVKIDEVYNIPPKSWVS